MSCSGTRKWRRYNEGSLYTTPLSITFTCIYRCKRNRKETKLKFCVLDVTLMVTPYYALTETLLDMRSFCQDKLYTWRAFWYFVISSRRRNNSPVDASFIADQMSLSEISSKVTVRLFFTTLLILRAHLWWILVDFIDPCWSSLTPCFKSQWPDDL